MNAYNMLFSIFFISRYENCHSANLNGFNYNIIGHEYASGINWNTWKGQYHSLKEVRMEIKAVPGWTRESTGTSQGSIDTSKGSSGTTKDSIGLSKEKDKSEIKKKEKKKRRRTPKKTDW